jgi:predicted exporter
MIGAEAVAWQRSHITARDIEFSLVAIQVGQNARRHTEAQNAQRDTERHRERQTDIQTEKEINTFPIESLTVLILLLDLVFFSIILLCVALCDIRASVLHGK